MWPENISFTSTTGEAEFLKTRLNFPLSWKSIMTQFQCWSPYSLNNSIQVFIQIVTYKPQQKKMAQLHHHIMPKAIVLAYYRKPT